VPMASTNLPADRIVADGDMALVQMTPEQLAERDLPLDEVMMDAAQIFGRRLREPVAKGEPFLTSALYLEGGGPNLAERLPPGYRAVNVSVSDLVRPSVVPNSYVDVVFRSEPQLAGRGEEGIPEVTVTLLEGVQVLEVARPSAADVAGATEVILAVKAEEVNVLQAVEGKGRLALVSRPAPDPPPAPGDPTAAAARLTLKDVLGIPPPPEPPEELRTVIVRGGRVQVNTFVGNQMQTEGDCPSCGGGSREPMVPTPDPGGREPTLAPPQESDEENREV